MNWEATAAVAELLGAIGVIASLIYLAGQVRSSATITRQAAVQSVANKIHQVFEDLAQDKELSEIWVRGSKGTSHLDDEVKKVQYSCLLFTMMKPYEELFHYRKDGAVDDWAWQSVRNNLSQVIGTRGWEEWWALRASWFSSEFQKYAEGSADRVEYKRWVTGDQTE